jgi:acetylornithine deacetylase/succinyl-diaminopimelate desuccinylase-like protein
VKKKPGLFPMSLGVSKRGECRKKKARGTRPQKSNLTHPDDEEGAMYRSDLMTPELQAELIEFTQRPVRAKSLSGQEEAAIRLIEAKMNALGYDEVNDAEKWDLPPFSGAVVAGRLHGRGSVDMKSGAAASIYAAALARKLGLDSGKTIYVSCGLFEEDCDGENLKQPV